jgi:CheY-like chemotaxis protein
MLASEAGFDRHLTKPITRKELERVLLSVTKQDVQLEGVAQG